MSIFRHIQKIILYALIAHFILKYLRMKSVLELLSVCAVEIAPSENHVEVSVISNSSIYSARVDQVSAKYLQNRLLP